MRYKVKKNVPPRLPKKSKKKDIRRWSSVFFLIGLNLTLLLFYYAFNYRTIHYTSSSSSSSAVVTVPPPSSEATEAEEKILVINPEQIENLVNTEAFTHAVWPGYKGNISDGNKVRKHFASNLASVIINSGGVEVNKTYKVHFYYVVRDDGNIQFLSLVGDGKTTPDTPKFILKRAQELVNIGVPGIKPGTDVNGDPITVVYELVITFKPA